MIYKSLHPDRSYCLFLRELKALVRNAGILPSRRPIIASASDDAEENVVPLSRQNVQQRVGRIVLYMEAHLEEQLSLKKLAEEVRLSKYQLIRGFQEEEGTTPWKFLVAKRIERVKALLEEGVPAGQAAVEAGFYDQSHLHKAFKEQTGCTPKEYQEQNFKNRN